MAPGLILFGEADDEANDLGRLLRSSGAPRVSPAACNESAVPGKDRLRTRQQRSPARLGQNPAAGSEKRPIVGGEIWPWDLASEHLELVAQDHDLYLLRALRAKAQDHELKESAQGQVQEGHDHEVARLGFHSRRRLGHST
jgi:hypothetical protein